ncbi:MAG: hypothetical protein P8177_03835 [Gemmatimonadota bacterium]
MTSPFSPVPLACPVPGVVDPGHDNVTRRSDPREPRRARRRPDPGVRYARTDIGGACRGSPEAGRWEPPWDGLSNEDRNLMGGESVAVDPSDPDRVYLALGQ